MTLWDLIRAMLRRWPIVLIGAAVTGLLGAMAIRDQGVYFTRTEVVFLAPSTWYPNVLQTTPETVIVTAGLVVKRIVGADEVMKYGSADATIIGTRNTREDTWIRLADSGGQWATNFADPVVLIDVVAPTRERARELQQAAIDRIREELVAIQEEHGVAPDQQMTTTVAPDSTQIFHVAGNRARAVGMTLFLGGIATISVVGFAETGSARRRTRTARTRSKLASGEPYVSSLDSRGVADVHGAGEPAADG